MDYSDVKVLIPHRFPMMLVDRVLSLIPDERVVAVKAVSGNEPWYGRFASTDPAAFRYPPVLLIESWCQSAGALVSKPGLGTLGSGVPVLASLTNIEFRGPVFPGDLVVHDIRVVRALSDAMVVEGESRVGGEPVMTVGAMTMAVRPAEQLRPKTETMAGETK